MIDMSTTIAELEKLEKELKQRLSAVDTALSVLRQVESDLGGTDQSLLFEEEVDSEPSQLNKVIKNPPMDFSLIKDMNRGGGGIRCDL